MVQLAKAQVADTQPKKRKRNVQQTDLNSVEERRVEDLILRFQDLVVAKNRKRGGRERAESSESDMVRAGLIRLEEADDDDFHESVTKAKNRE